MIKLKRREFYLQSVAIAGVATAGMAGSALSFAHSAMARGGTVTIAAPASLVTPAFRDAFKKGTGIEVSVAPWSNNAEVISKMIVGQMSGVDLISLWDSNLGRLTARNLVQPLDPARLPQRKDMFSYFESRGMAVGKLLGQPHMWGYDSIIYNADKVRTVDSWKTLFDPTYKGKVALRDDADETLTVAALALGIQNPMTLSTTDLKRTSDFLIRLKRAGQFRTFWSSFAEAVNLMASGEVTIMHGWMAMVPAIRSAHVNAVYATPREGGLGFIHDYVIPAGSPNPAGAYVYLNWCLSEEYAEILAANNYLTVVKTDNPKIPAGIRSQLEQAEQILRKLDMQVLPDNMPDYIQAWNLVRSA